jgi:flagellar protein FlaF
MHHAAKAYGTVAKQLASPREVEANLLLKSASRLQAVRDRWDTDKGDFSDALAFNRKLWTILVTEVTESGNPLPREIRQNVANLGLFIIKQSISLLIDPKPQPLASLIDINRNLAAGLLGR